ncbi:MAG: hypothetical protein E7052_11375 [Lentisphaerae bacterium]|nr:hypothetical protein [Lentisphaerota bacterium]
MEKVYDWFVNNVIAMPCGSDFERGFQAALLLAALVFFLLIVICLICKIIFRRPAVPGVTLEREDGDIFISRNAIFTAVCRLEREFPELEIIKVNMQRNRHKELGLTVSVLFDEKESSFDAVAGAFKQRVFVMLTKSFGIETIKSVAINLAKIPADTEDFDSDAAAKTPTVNNGFGTGI